MLIKNRLVKRYAHNPILTAEDVPYPCNEISNVAAVKYKEEYQSRRCQNYEIY